ncbi:nitrate- and nitrite sensing domain-containing protein [Polymorphospora sp. NPDC051019]|uniref:sensor histidine kinase n=1 Tax=Polymorphospora sp. NPDC051019 TaxID=3155725 RepID=UPI0034319F92
MSSQPEPANSMVSRLRRPFGRLRDLPIWSKLGLIMVVPILATVIVGANGLITHLETHQTADRARSLASLSQVSGELVQTLQDERAAAVMLLGAGENAQLKERYLQTYDGQRKNVDDATGPYTTQRNALDGLPANFSGLLGRIDQTLVDLPGIRSQVVNGTLRINDAAQSYEGLISDLLDIRDSAAQLAGDTELSERMRAAAAISRSKEYLSLRRIVVHRALIQGALTPVLRTDYIATQTGQQQALQSFQAAANQSESAFYEQTVAGSEQREADSYSGYVRGKTTDNLDDAPFDADEWDAAMAGNANLIRAVETKLDGDVVDLATDLRDGVQRQLLIETGLLLGTVLLAIFFAWLVARSMARSLQELRHGALNVARYGLPQAVSRLRDPKIAGQYSPEQIAEQVAEPLPVRSRDEFGQVTEAFNAVHLEAVRTAAQQAALRASVSTMFVNLARRSQILVDRLIGHLDRLERGEEDPDRLAELFQLDHLVTRMRRNDENLLVLAAADSTRVQREPAALIDVLRAAQAEVEHYTRIEFGVVDRDIEVAAPAVNDLVHLVAELFDNATAFSSPDSHVMVEARRVGDNVGLYVEDQGIGIKPDLLRELNDRIASPPQMDVAVSRMMGLVVVARLAARHDVRVELRPGTERGTVAEVTLPPSVLVPRSISSGRTAAGALEMSLQAPPTKGSPFAAPLALEGGSGEPARPAAGPLPGDPAPSGPGLGGRPFDPMPLNGGGLGAGGRGMPAWSDLTGASAANGGNGNGRGRPVDVFTPRQHPDGEPNEPLPQRRANDHWTVDGEIAASGGGMPGIPRQLPATPESRTGMVPPVSAPPVASGPPATSPPVSAPPVAPPPGPAAAPSGAVPPAWPPVAADDREPAGGEREQVTPQVPEDLAAALDMTTELPRIPRRTADTSLTVPPVPENRLRFADETMELPIFRELESAWFRTRRSVPEDASPSTTTGADDSSDQFVTADAARVLGPGQGTSTGTTGNAAMANTPWSTGESRGRGPAATSAGATAAGNGGGATRGGEAATTAGWQTAADDGWRAASAAAEVSATATTQTGLPKRVPMAQLVPGGVDKPTSSVQRRTPEAVRGLLSAYHRGVQRGRTQPKDENPGPERTSDGQQSSQGAGGFGRPRPEGA